MVNAGMTAVLIAMVISVYVNCFAGMEKDGLSVWKNKYIDQSRHNEIIIFYPQLRGIGDDAREKQINDLIKQDEMKIVCRELYFEDTFYCSADYEVKLVNEDIISIYYEGRFGSNIAAARPLHPVAATTNVALKTGKLLTLNDVVTDLEALAGMLLEEKFESITLWEGEKTAISEYQFDREELIRGMQKEEWDVEGTNFGWYTDGRYFVVVIYKRIYNEFAIDISEVEDILDHGFLEMLGW